MNMNPSQSEPPGQSSKDVIKRRYDVERSCIRCHERKVRCDRANPCSNCLRAKIPCRYPGPERTKRRSQKKPTARTDQFGPRLAMLERAIATLTQQAAGERDRLAHTSSSPASTEQTPENTNTHTHASRGSPNEGLLVKEGTSTRYMDESLFMQLLEKESELRSAIDSPTSSDGSLRLSSSFDGLISKPQGSTDITSLYPSRGQARQLWQIYLNNVDALIKILHVPSIQPVIFAAINKPKDTAADLNALIFAIFFAAVTTLSSEETQMVLGSSRHIAVESYRRGMEVSLHKASFLDSPTLHSIQAMAIYLMCSRHHNGRSGSAWSLNGMLIRAAQWMGLHRDGAQFDISPLTCEIRRRLWFEILAADGRAAEDHALSSSGFNGFTDTKLPLNLDDRDLTPDMKEMPVSKACWTEMTLFLVVTEMNLAMNHVARLSAAVRNEHERLSNLEQFLEKSKSRVQVQYLQYCDPNMPLQKATLCLCHVFLGKLEVFVRHQYHRGLSPEESVAQIKEETLVLACETIDFGNELKTSELLNNFQWLFATFRQYHLLTYTLWHLCIQPGTSYAEQAWETVHYTFRLEENPNWPNPGVKWNVLCKLRDKAYNIRSAYLAASMNQSVPQPFGAQNVDVDQPSNFLDLDFDTLGDLGSICFPNWGSADFWSTGPFE